MYTSKQNYHCLIPILFFLILLSLCCIFSYHIKKPIPSGVDATNYIPAAQWIEKTGQVPDTYQPIQFGFFAYTSPFPSLYIGLLKIFTTLNIVFPLFSLFQLFVFLFLALTTYLAGSIYNKWVGLFSSLFMLISQGYAFLFTSSTIANLLALSFVNIIFYLLFCFHNRISKRTPIIILIIIFVSTLFLTHRQLTFPLFLFVFFIYLAYILLKFRGKTQFFLQQLYAKIKINRIWSLIFFSVAIALLLVVCYELYVYLSSIVTEWIKAYVVDYRFNRFAPQIKPQDWLYFWGPLYSIFGVIGLYFIAKKFKQNVGRLYFLFPIIWIITTLLLSLINNLGISFETPRWLYQGYIFFSLLSGIGVFEILKSMKRSQNFLLVMFMALLVSTIFIHSALMNKHHSDTSNYVTADDIAAYAFLYRQTEYGEKLLSNQNKLSVGFDRLLLNMERKVDYNLENIKDNNSNFEEYLKMNDIQYVVARNSSNDLTKYLNDRACLKNVYKNKNVVVFQRI